MKDKSALYASVYEILRRIPKGKATTYGKIAKRVGINPRFVGRILSKNDHPEKYPCYKVVRSDGSLGGYTINGKVDPETITIKRRKLLEDGVRFNKDNVDKSSLV